MALLRVRKGARAGSVFPVFTSRQPTIIGRDEQAGQVHFGLGDPRASRRHAGFFLEGGSWCLEDLGSSNGTYLQGKRLERRAQLPDGASIQAGATLLSFHASELPPAPPEEIHGARPIECVREECGVFVLRAHQAAIDREVRCDWLHPSHALPGSLGDRIEQAIEEAQKLSDPCIVPLIHARSEQGSTFVLLRGSVRRTLEDQLPDVLALPLGSRMEIFRQLVDAALERAAWEGLRLPVAPRHCEVDTSALGSAEGGPAVFLPALDLGVLLAAGTGSLAHIAHYAPYLPPELQEPRGKDAGRNGAHPLASAVYNLGALGYHLLTGERPMGEGGVEATLENHRTLRPAPAALLDAAVPEGLSALLEHMLEKDPAKRPAGRQEILRAFPAVSSASAAPPPVRAAGPAPSGGAGLPPEPPAPSQARSPAAPQAMAGTPARPAPARASAARAAPARPRPASGKASAKPSPPAPGEPSLPALLYLPLWGIAWVALFFAARYLSKMVFHSLGG